MRNPIFNELPVNRQLHILNEFAVPVFSMEYYDHRLNLFSLGSYFIEVYEDIDTRRIEKICVATYSDLDKYLSQILIKL